MKPKNFFDLQQVMSAVNRDCDASFVIRMTPEETFERWDQTTLRWVKFRPHKNQGDAMWLAARFGISFYWSTKELERGTSGRLKLFCRSVIKTVIQHYY